MAGLDAGAPDSGARPQRAAAPQDGPGAVLRIAGARFAWGAAGADVIDIEALEVAAGERIILAGPSGSGKSTLLSLIGGVNVPRQGSVEVLGADLGRLSGARRDRFRADHVGFVFQLFNLVPYLSTIENVTLPCRFSRRRHARATASGGRVEDEARRLLTELHLGDEALHGRTVTGLSIGQQQRVAVARALIGAPELVIADEPTSALDEGTRERFLDLLFAECAAAEATLIFVSHDTRLGPLFDRELSLAAVNRTATSASPTSRG